MKLPTIVGAVFHPISSQNSMEYLLKFDNSNGAIEIDSKFY